MSGRSLAELVSTLQTDVDLPTPEVSQAGGTPRWTMRLSLSKPGARDSSRNWTPLPTAI